jgi:hypothetical protein
MCGSVTRKPLCIYAKINKPSTGKKKKRKKTAREKKKKKINSLESYIYHLRGGSNGKLTQNILASWYLC